MSLNKIIKREIEVAFAKTAQPTWARILKYIILATLIYFFWRITWFWIILAFVFALALTVHFWYRFKTQGWTKTYGAWKYEKNVPKNP